ncbi:hypothetical protein [Methylobacterium planeticum]|nr:hypothetical protein [Methylobacterium planeticum]
MIGPRPSDGPGPPDVAPRAGIGFARTMLDIVFIAAGLAFFGAALHLA